ncbi:Bug family tripartite tricarboxylate transporter substrate binding protein [Bordetella petrii]|uniref:Secreted protein n=1 Tax=Bordetella petrii (strain ATCC BAA-461 / DSM 12804 / CCUG 43448 / CIP 107267 / Se-1111R) TaxID=340100 RepID=A9IDP5_BORPD|nr:tripartite tricarboxylate transporter substrate binding protein [Bordetella petrii]CAP41584.1 putative secreted protein [Bordetella petrii]
MRKYLYCAIAALAMACTNAQADWPEKPVALIVPAAPGGTTDILARELAAQLAATFGQPFVVENRSGAGGNIGTAYVAKSRSDGYTILIGSMTNHVVNPVLMPSTPFKGVDDFTPVAYLANVLNTVVVNASLPVKNMQELIDYARANPGKIMYASGGNGSSNHIGGLMLEKMSGIKINHVPYRGGAPAVLATSAGETQLFISAGTQTLPQVKAGKLRLLAVTEAKRSVLLPDVPTVSETVPGYETTVWYGAFAPAGTSPQIVARLNEAINNAFAVPAVKRRLEGMGIEPVSMSPEAFGKVLRDEEAKYAKLIKELNIKME